MLTHFEKLWTVYCPGIMVRVATFTKEMSWGAMSRSTFVVSYKRLVSVRHSMVTVTMPIFIITPILFIAVILASFNCSKNLKPHDRKCL